MLKLIDILGG